MNAWKPLSGALALLALGLGWYAWREHRALADLQKRSAAEAKELGDLRDTAAKYKTRLDRIEAQRKATLERRRAAQAAGGAAAANEAKRRGDMVDLTSYMERDPAYERMRQARALRSVAQQYGSALASLGLPPDKLAKLRQLLADRMLAPQDAQAAAEAQGLDPNSREVSQAAGQSMSEINGEIKDLVGPDALQQLQNASMQTMMRQRIQNEYAADLSAAGVPLSESQIDALAAAEAQAQQQAVVAMRAGLKGPDAAAAFQQAQAEALLTAAAKVLSPDQTAALQQSVAQNEQMQALVQRAKVNAEKDLGHPLRSWSYRGP